MLVALIGGMMFSTPLLENMSIPLQVDYINISRYHGEIKAGNRVTTFVEPKISIKGRTVVIVDDVLDGGVTFAKIKQYCEELGAKKVYTAVMTQSS